MGNIVELSQEFKAEIEQGKTLAPVQNTITALVAENKALTNEVERLKLLLAATNSALGQENEVLRVILTPEEALIEGQIEILQNRAINFELTLEDVKKLDLLIKNKRLVKEQSTTIQGESKKIDKKNHSNAELILLAAKKDG